MSEKKKRAEAVGLTVPLAPIRADGYAPHNLELRLDQRQARILRAVAEQLNADGATAGGHPVTHPAHAVEWILDQIADTLDQVAQG